MTGRQRRHSSTLRPAAVLTAGLAGLALQFGAPTAAADDTPSGGSDAAVSGPVRAARSAGVHRAALPRPQRRDSRIDHAANAVPTPAPRSQRVPVAVIRIGQGPSAAAPSAAVGAGAVPQSSAPSTVPAGAPRRALQQIDAAVTAGPDASALADGLPARGFAELLQGALLLARNTWSEAALRRGPRPTLGWVPRYDHIVVVVLENHSFDEIRGLADTNQPPVPYINNTLVPGGALMTASYGLQHPSQPNYYWLFSGNNQGVTTDTSPIVNGVNTVDSTARNLYTELEGLCRPKTFIGYVEGYSGPADLNSAGGVFNFTGAIASQDQGGTLNNVVRHMPWAGFANVPQDVTVGFESFTDIDYSTLPDVSFVIPALQHDMHNFDYGADAENADIATSDTSMSNSDAWLQQNLDGYAQWARAHNSLLIITTDEDSTADWPTPPLTEVNYHGPKGEANAPGAPGFTSAAQGPSATDQNPSGAAQSGPNTIFTLFYGAHVVPGEYSNPITNVNVLRTIEASMGIRTKAGAQPKFVGSTAAGTRAWGFRFNNRAVANVFSLCAR